MWVRIPRPEPILVIMKTIERNLYLEVQDTADGSKILHELVIWLCDLKHRYPDAYLNGWIGPVKEAKKKSKKTK